MPIIFEIHENEVGLALERILASYPDYPKKVLPGVTQTLNLLHSQGYTLGIISSTSLRTLEYDLANAQFKKIFDYIQTQEDTLYHKPDRRVFEPTLEWLRARDIYPESVLYVGDGLHDMKAAQGAGFQFIGVESGLVDANMFRDAGVASVARMDLLDPNS